MGQGRTGPGVGAGAGEPVTGAVDLPGPLVRCALVLGEVTRDALLERLRAAGVRTNAYGEALWRRVEVAGAPRPVTVVIGTAAAFGLPGGVTLDELAAHGAEHGLGPCPLEVALLLRLGWDDAPGAGRVTVVSEHDGDDAAPRGFYLRQDAEGRWLRGFVASADWRFGEDERFVLLRGP